MRTKTLLTVLSLLPVSIYPYDVSQSSVHGAESTIPVFVLDFGYRELLLPFPRVEFHIAMPILGFGLASYV
jgi:hypothetical protein